MPVAEASNPDLSQSNNNHRPEDSKHHNRCSRDGLLNVGVGDPVVLKAEVKLWRRGPPNGKKDENAC